MYTMLCTVCSARVPFLCLAFATALYFSIKNGLFVLSFIYGEFCCFCLVSKSCLFAFVFVNVHFVYIKSLINAMLLIIARAPNASKRFHFKISMVLFLYINIFLFICS